MCLISISSAGMQELLNVYHFYSFEQSLWCNRDTSYLLCFTSKTTFAKLMRPCFYLGEMFIPKVDYTQCKYLGDHTCIHISEYIVKRQMKKINTIM